MSKIKLDLSEELIMREEAGEIPRTDRSDDGISVLTTNPIIRVAVQLLSMSVIERIEKAINKRLTITNS